jgi:hypothetical protein
VAVYASLGDLRGRLNLTEGQDEALLILALGWASRFVEAATDRVFVAASATRYYRREALDPDNRRRLVLDEDLVSVTTLTNGDGAALAADAYWLEPRNESPKSSILLKSDYSWTWDTDEWVAVAGLWGYASAPDDLIKGVTLRLAEWGYRSKDLLETVTPFSETISTKLPPGFPAEVLTQLETRRRLR